MTAQTDRAESLAFAREALLAVRNAYKAYQSGGNGAVKSYSVQDRRMEYRDAADLLAQIKHWENEVERLERLAGNRPPRRIRVNF
ncbi:hypothetical protein [Chitinilyticum aquatile]|uniref:hypothetical protein n=1 Tax=Chitinilyticum aquatile TaxID=362520 RepID=UPI00041A1264|nr:hypothetical protein [Chitinilyticum aquatile]